MGQTQEQKGQAPAAAMPGHGRMMHGCGMKQGVMPGQGMQHAPGQGMQHGSGQAMQMMPMCMHMMQQMHGHTMAAQETMQMMKDIVTMQERIVRGIKPGEKTSLLRDLTILREKIDRRVSEMVSTSAGGMGMPCASASDHTPAATPSGVAPSLETRPEEPAKPAGDQHQH
jgi:hypothetical protein